MKLLIAIAISVLLASMAAADTGNLPSMQHQLQTTIDHQMTLQHRDLIKHRADVTSDPASAPTLASPADSLQRLATGVLVGIGHKALNLLLKAGRAMLSNQRL